jgi:hypothetical protein
MGSEQRVELRLDHTLRERLFKNQLFKTALKQFVDDIHASPPSSTRVTCTTEVCQRPVRKSNSPRNRSATPCET